MKDPVNASLAERLLTGWEEDARRTAPAMGGMAAIRARTALPLADLYYMEEMAVPVEYGLHPYTAIGEISLLSAPPKVGKSTFASILALNRPGFTGELQS
jgi:hypothetical protein